MTNYSHTHMYNTIASSIDTRTCTCVHVHLSSELTQSMTATHTAPMLVVYSSFMIKVFKLNSINLDSNLSLFSFFGVHVS